MYGVSQSVLFFAFSCTFAFGAYLVGEHELGYEQGKINLAWNGLNGISVFRIFSAIIFGGNQLGRAASSAPDFAKAKDSAARIFKLLDRIPAYADPYDTKGRFQSRFNWLMSLFRWQMGLQGRHPLQKSAIHIPDKKGYPSSQCKYSFEKLLLRHSQGLDVSIKAGQTLALVGQSGCGKSTCMQLIQR